MRETVYVLPFIGKTQFLKPEKRGHDQPKYFCEISYKLHQDEATDSEKSIVLLAIVYVLPFIGKTLFLISCRDNVVIFNGKKYSCARYRICFAIHREHAIFDTVPEKRSHH